MNLKKISIILDKASESLLTTVVANTIIIISSIIAGFVIEILDFGSPEMWYKFSIIILVQTLVVIPLSVIAALAFRGHK